MWCWGSAAVITPCSSWGHGVTLSVIAALPSLQGKNIDEFIRVTAADDDDNTAAADDVGGVARGENVAYFCAARPRRRLFVVCLTGFAPLIQFHYFIAH